MITAADGSIYGNAGGRVFGFDPAQALEQQSADASLRILFQGADPHLTADNYGNLYVGYGTTRLLRINPR